MAYTLKDIAEYIGGILSGDGNVLVTGISSLDEAGENDISFIAQRKYLSRLKTTRACALIVPMEVTEAQVPVIRTENPYLAYARTVEYLTREPFAAKGVSNGAIIGEGCQIDANVSIYPLAFIGNKVKIASGVIIFPGAYVGNEVSIGSDTVIYPQAAVLDRCTIGSRVIIHSGAVIGSDGFGYAKDGKQYVKIQQIGTVRIDDDVEIGANTTIDRAALGKTWIKRGTKIDNLVMVAHNVVVGEDALLIGQAGISGSVEVGNGVILAGQAGIAGHCKIGDRTTISAKTGVPGSVPPDSVISGMPAIPHREWLKASVAYRRLPDMVQELRILRNRVEALEAKAGGQEDERKHR